MSKTTSEAHSNLFDVKDYVVCVTGASSGLGRATATILANRGARVIGIARSREELEAWQESGHGETAIVSADLCKREEFPKVIKEVTAPFGAPDILINAAGVNLRRPADIVSQEEWDQTIQLNLNAPFFLAQALVPGMKAKKWGRIVNFASLQSRRAFPDGIAYGATKGGIEQLTRAMAEAWSRYGILTNALAPGFFPTKADGTDLFKTKSCRRTVPTNLHRSQWYDGRSRRSPALSLFQRFKLYHGSDDLC